jgi:YXWGXW repeat-containing protein
MHINRSIRCLLFALVMLAMPVAASAQLFVAVNFGPPPLPVYVQPYCPGEGYIWTPGYWAFDYDYDDYYWVPGTWVLVPQPGFYWTPGYWAWDDDRFFFHEGYWGPQVGFYGGIAYGYGYTGDGYEGGRWDNGRFFYNRSVNNVNVTEIHNTYNTTVINNTTTNVSYNGGSGGIQRQPNSREEAAAHERHIAPVAAQMHQVQIARANPQLRASVNQGRPPIAATSRPGEFKGRGVVAAKAAGAPYKPAVHPNDLPPFQHPAASGGNQKVDRKYQQQQDKLFQQQQQERQRLQQKQDQDHQRLEQQQAAAARKQQAQQQHQQQAQEMMQRQAMQQRADEARRQQIEQQHQVQTQQMMQRQAMQQQRMQQRQPQQQQRQPQQQQKSQPEKTAPAQSKQPPRSNGHEEQPPR